MAATEELIEARKVVGILGISLATLRDYKKRGLIVVAAKRGNTDLYDKADVVQRHSIIREKRRQGFSLSQISGMLDKEAVNVINLPGPEEPAAEMSNQELLHGFLADLYRNASLETKNYINELSKKWNIQYRQRSE